MEFKPFVFPMLGLLLVAGIFTLFRARRYKPGQNLAERFVALAKARATRPLPAACGLNEAAQALKHPLADQFAATYGGAIYRDRKLDRDEIRALRRLLDELDQSVKNVQRSPDHRG